MNITEYIAELQAIKDEHGDDMPVVRKRGKKHQGVPTVASRPKLRRFMCQIDGAEDYEGFEPVVVIA